MALSGCGSELPGPLTLHERQPIRDYLSLFVSIPGVRPHRKHTHTHRGNVTPHTHTHRQAHTAQWTKAFYEATGMLGREQGKMDQRWGSGMTT